MSKSNSKSRLEIIGAIKSAFSINFPFYLFSIGILLTFSAFQCDNIENCEEMYCEVDDSDILIEANITVEEVICGFGVWDNFWFNDGSNIYLQPYSLDESLTNNIKEITIEDGMKLKIQYFYSQTDDRYNDVTVCQAYVGVSTPIRIISIDVIDK